MTIGPIREERAAVARRRPFVLSEGMLLEERALMSRIGLVSPALIEGRPARAATVQPGPRLIPRAAINLAFDQFQAEYTFQRDRLLADGPLTEPVRQAFLLYTEQSTDALASDLVGILLPQTRSQPKHAKNRVTIVPASIARQINAQTAAGAPQNGTLAQALVSAIPPADAPVETFAFYKAAQDSAIESARQSVLNGLAAYYAIQKRK